MTPILSNLYSAYCAGTVGRETSGFHSIGEFPRRFIFAAPYPAYIVQLSSYTPYDCGISYIKIV